MAGVGDKPPPPNFGKSINPNLIHFFHPIGSLKIIKSLKYVVAVLNQSVEHLYTQLNFKKV